MFTYIYHHYEYCIPKLVLYKKVSLIMYIHIYIDEDILCPLRRIKVAAWMESL